MSCLLNAARALRKNPGLSVSIVLLLGLGIGANTALFSALHAILLRPIPGVERSEELVRIRRSAYGRVQGNQSFPDYLDLRDQTRTMRGLVAERQIALRMAGPPAQMVPSAIVSGNYFEVLGARPKVGRLLGAEDDRVPGGHPVVVLSERFWRTRSGGDPAVVGRSLVLNGTSFTIVGVAAEPFAGVEAGERADLWIPLMMVRTAMTRQRDYHWLTERRAGYLTFFGRLQPGATERTVEAELNTIGQRLAALYPDSNAGRTYVVHRHAEMQPEERASLSSLLGALGAAVGLVLLIACGNVANLLLGRAAARGREMAIRVALGADRRQLMMHLMSENLLLGLGGAGLGLLLAPWMQSLLRTVWSAPQWGRDATSLSLPVLGFTLGISMIAVVLCGLAPAWIATRVDPAAALKSGTSRAAGGSRLQPVWVVAQVALSVALVAAGSLVVRSMQRILAIDPGYRPESIVLATMDLSVLEYSPEAGKQMFLDLMERASALPGVRSATVGKSSPAVDWSDRVTVFRQGEAPTNGSDPSRAPGGVLTDQNVIGPAYFRTLQIPLQAGREFTAGDRTGSQPVAIVSRGLAEKLWPGENAIGKQLVLPAARQPLPAALSVIGVAADARYRSVLNPAPLLVYVPVLQTYDSIARLMVAVDGSPAPFAGTLLRLLQQMNPDLPVRVATMSDQLEASLWRQRAATSLLSFFSVLALALACAGINGVVAYGAAQRTREIGIRMALGAARGDVVRGVVGQAMKLTCVGVLVGTPLALWAKPALASVLYGAEGVEPAAVLGVPLLFLAVAVAASWRPARRASKVDPLIALRQE